MAIYIENDLTSGTTAASTTFGNPKLAKPFFFDIEDMEVFGVSD